MKDGTAQSGDSQLIPVRDIGGASSASLALRGTVLIHKATSWTGRTSVFIPIECLSVSHTRRYDRRYLLQGLRVLLASVLISLTLGIPLAWKQGELDDAPGWLLMGVAAVSGVTALYFLYTVARFLRRSPAVRFEAEVYDGRITIECWNRPEDRSAMNGLLTRIDALQTQIDDLVPYPSRHSYELFHLHPFRVSVMQALLFSLLLYVPVRFAVHYVAATWLYAFLLLPPLFYLGRYGLDHIRMMMQPVLFREAVGAYDREDLPTARCKLDALLAEWPDYVPGLLLYAQVCTLLSVYDAAFGACDRIDDLVPDLGAPLRDEILSIERIQRRMEDAV